MDLLNLLPFQNGEAIDSVGVIIIGTTLVLLFIALRRLGKHKTSNNTQQNHKHRQRQQQNMSLIGRRNKKSNRKYPSFYFFALYIYLYNYETYSCIPVITSHVLHRTKKGQSRLRTPN